MNKILCITVLASLTLSNYAISGEYSDAVATQQNCEVLGDIASATYDSRKSPKARKEALAGTEPSPDDDDYKSHAKETMRKALTYAVTKARSKKDAYMTAWGYCMDAAN